MGIFEKYRLFRKYADPNRYFIMLLFKSFWINPAKTKLYIDFQKYDEEGFQFSINNLSGVTLISSENFRHLPKEINVSSITSGVYILTVVTLKNRWNFKIVID